MENINGVSGSGVSLKTSTFLLVLMRVVLEQGAPRRCFKNQRKLQNCIHGSIFLTYSLPAVVCAGNEL